MRWFFAMVAGSVVALSVTITSASGVSSAAFRAKAPADLPYIVHNSTASVLNGDVSLARSVVAGLSTGATDYTPTAKILVVGNGGVISCSLFSRNVDTGSLSSTNASGTVEGRSNAVFSLGLTLPNGPGYSHSAECSLPPQTEFGAAGVLGATIL